MAGRKNKKKASRTSKTSKGKIVPNIECIQAQIAEITDKTLFEFEILKKLFDNIGIFEIELYEEPVWYAVPDKTIYREVHPDMVKFTKADKIGALVIEPSFIKHPNIFSLYNPNARQTSQKGLKVLEKFLETKTAMVN